MSTHRAIKLSAVLFLLAHATQAAAQISPSSMRSGSTPGVGPAPGGVVLYTVPPGQTFVLTDVTWTAYPFYPVTGFGSLIQILPLGGPPRLSWWAFDTNTTVSGDHENPVGAHLTTGLTFDAGNQVMLQVGAQAMPGNVTWILSWSGYLAPAGSSAAPTLSGSQIGLNFSTKPNPSDHDVAVDFRLPANGNVVLAIFDVQGRRIRTLVHGEMAAGAYSIPWDGNNDEGHAVSDGTYFARLETPSSSEVRKVTRLR